VHKGFVAIFGLFDRDLSFRHSTQSNRALGLFTSPLVYHSIGALFLNYTEFLLPAVFQNPVGRNRLIMDQITILCRVNIVLDDVSVFAPLDKEEMPRVFALSMVRGPENRR